MAARAETDGSAGSSAVGFPVEGPTMRAPPDSPRGAEAGGKTADGTERGACPTRCGEGKAASLPSSTIGFNGGAEVPLDASESSPAAAAEAEAPREGG